MTLEQHIMEKEEEDRLQRGTRSRNIFTLPPVVAIKWK